MAGGAKPFPFLILNIFVQENACLRFLINIFISHYIFRLLSHSQLDTFLLRSHLRMGWVRR